MKKHPLASLCLISAIALTAASCERKEKVIDIQTPGGSVEVERDKKSGDVEIQVDKER